jgi:hypothetical protein
VDDVGFIKIGQIERRFRICGVTLNHMGPNFMHLVDRPDNVGFIICGVIFNHIHPNSIHLVDRLGIVGFIKLSQIESRFRSCGVVFNHRSPNFIHLVDSIDAVGLSKWVELTEGSELIKPKNLNENLQVGGYVTVYDKLTFSTVRGAGHMVPYTEPARALHLVKSFINKTPL